MPRRGRRRRRGRATTNGRPPGQPGITAMVGSRRRRLRQRQAATSRCLPPAMRQCHRCMSVMSPRPCIWPARGRMKRPRATRQRVRQRIGLRLQPGWAWPPALAGASPWSRRRRRHRPLACFGLRSSYPHPCVRATSSRSRSRRRRSSSRRSSSRRRSICSSRSRSGIRLRRRRLQGRLPREPRSRRRRRRGGRRLRRSSSSSRGRARRLSILPGRSRLLRCRSLPLWPKPRLLRNRQVVPVMPL